MEEQHVVDDVLTIQQDVKREIIEIERKKLKNKFLIIGAVILGSDLLALLMINNLNALTFGIISVIPLIMLVLAFASRSQPILSVIIAALVILGAWAYTIYSVGAQGAFSGLFVKAIMIGILIRSFDHAKTITRTQKELVTEHI